MRSEELRLGKKTDDEVGAFGARVDPDTNYGRAVMIEFTLRQTKLARQQTDAAEKQAIAASLQAESTVELAKYTKQYTKYMLFSVVISILALLVVILR